MKMMLTATGPGMPAWPVNRLAICLAMAMISTQGSAASWDLNENWQLSTSTSLSAGTSWSMESPDAKLMTRADALSIGKNGTGINYNGDNGRLNYDKGDVISTLFKGITDFELSGADQGAVLRLKYWYDHNLETRNGDFARFDDSGWESLAKFKGLEVLDAYLWRDFDIAGRSVGVKLGKQVVSWGEALFLQNGINAINPLDAAAFNRPGVELKEGLLPVELFSLSADLTDSLSMEAFWQFNHRNTVMDGCGTFFAANDNIQEGCAFDRMIAGGQGTTPESILDYDSATNKVAAERYLQRGKSDFASDSGQYGLALRYVLENLGNAELGLYYMNYHSRTPLISGVIARDAPDFSPGAANPGVNINTGSYNTVYAEDIRLFGLSLSGVIGKTATFGELVYRPNQPLGLNAADFVALLTGADNTTIEHSAERGSLAQGYVRKPVWQFSLGAVGSMSNILGANRLSWAGEAGANWIQDIGSERLGRPGSFGRTPPVGGGLCTPNVGTGGLDADLLAGFNGRNCNTDGLLTPFSWGYRLRAGLNYESLLPDTVVSPGLSWRHDVKGYGPNFQEGQMAAGASLSFDYRNKYSMTLAYNSFFGSNDFSVIDDRDFASVTLKVDF